MAKRAWGALVVGLIAVVLAAAPAVAAPLCLPLPNWPHC
jgi:hypothetical protein